jgi:hypothetical protein
MMKIEQRWSGKYIITFEMVDTTKDIVMSIRRETLEQWRDEINRVLDSPVEKI